MVHRLLLFEFSGFREGYESFLSGWGVLPTIQWPRTIQSAAVLSILIKSTGLKSRVNV